LPGTGNAGTGQPVSLYCHFKSLKGL